MTSPATMALGKIKNATMAEVTAAIEDTVKMAEELLATINSGTDKETVLEQLKKTKQRHKQIEVIRLGKLKGKASSQMKKARSAAKKDDLETAKTHVAEAVKYYQELRKEFYDF